MKKFLAVLLATAMLLSVCVFSVFAVPTDPTETYHQLSTRLPNQLSEYHTSDDIIVEGWADLYIESGRSILYGVTIENNEKNEIVYHGYIQCAATFLDESMSLDSYSDRVVLTTSAYDNIYQRLYLTSGKTLVSIDAEFQVSSSGYLKWEGCISHTYTPGINL